MKVLIREPEYYKKFECDGVRCEDSCCVGWNIWIDKKHYDKIRNLKGKELKNKVKVAVKRYKKENNNSQHYAEIQLDDQGRCPFLTEEKLCGIQLKAGAKILPNVCRIYPRQINAVGNIIERSISLSCPIAAEKILFNKDGIRFLEVNEELEFGKVITTKYDFEIPKDFVWNLRIFAIQIMKSRDYDIWERLIILGLFIEKVDVLIKDKKFDNVDGAINDFTNLIVTGKMKDMLREIPSNINIQIKLLKEILDENLLTTSVVDKKNRYIQCLAESIGALGYDENYSFERVRENYKDFFEKYTKSYLKDKDYIFENFMVNYMFSKVFPFGDDLSLWDNYVNLVLYYSLIKMLLNGLMGHYEDEFDDRIILKLVQSFDRMYDHNANFKNHIYELIKKNNLNNMAYMTILIKD